MEELSDILEKELKKAVEIRDPDSLHRYVVILTQRLVEQRTHEAAYSTLLDEIRQISVSMQQGFELMEKRFAALDERFAAQLERFNAIDHRFDTQEKHFEALQKQIDERFRAQEQRFEDMNKRFFGIQRFMGVGFTVLAVLITSFNLFLFFLK
jgi:uncharacterized protein (DUF885 family)